MMSFEMQIMMGLYWSLSNLLRGRPVEWDVPDDGWDFSDVDVEYRTYLDSQEELDRKMGAFATAPPAKITWELVRTIKPAKKLVNSVDAETDRVRGNAP